MEEKNNETVDVTIGEKDSMVGTDTTKETKNLSFNELLATNKEYQAAHDKKVNEAIETAKKNWQEVNDAEKTEAEKLAKMNSEQKLEYQVKKAIREKEDAFAQLNAYQLKEKASEIANEKGLDVSLLNLIDFKTITAEKLNENIDNLSTVFNRAVERKVNERLKEDTPKTKTSDIGGSQPKPIPRVF